MKKIKISVTQEDIDHGTASDCATCPVALALKRTLKGNEVIVEEVYAGVNYLYFFYKKRMVYLCNTPRIVNKFMNDFDMGREVSPFDFEVEVEGI